MDKIRIELNSEGVRQLLLSSDAERICRDEAKKILGKLGEGYAMDTYRGKNRVNAMVYAQTDAAKEDNAENNSILKAVSK